VDFYTNGTNWAIGLTDKMPGCQAELTSPPSSACSIDYNNDGVGSDRVLMRIVGADYKNITMSQQTGFADPAVFPGACSTTNNEQACFDFIRGLARTGAYDFDSENYKLRVEVTLLGHVNICLPSGEKKIPGYDDC